MNWLKSIVDRHFDKFFLLALYFGGALLLIHYPMNDHLGQWITSGAVIGAILMLITGNKKNPPAPDGPTTGKVVTDTHTEEETK